MYDRTSLSATINGTADFLNSYAYNADQQLTMVQQQQQTGGNTVAPKEVDYVYIALGQFTSVSDYNLLGSPRTDVLTGTYSYDNGARLTGLAYTSDAGQTTIDTLGWGYDAASKVTSFSSVDSTATYGYDPTNQLTSATYTTAPGGHQPGNESYSFDSNGNRTNTGYSTGSDNEMTSDGTFNYQHDADGNTTVRTRISDAYATDYRTVYTWDYRNRLTDVEYFDNNSVLTKHVHFVYDVFDHLLATEVDTTGDGTYDSVQHYVLNVSPEIPSAGVPGTALAQPDFAFDSYGNIIQRNLVALDPAGVDAVIAQEMVNQGGAVTWLADNNLGSPVDVVNSSGVLANHIVYAAFGQEVYESNNAAIHWAGFAGGHDDPNTGLVNNYHRWYDPATGRWLSIDPSQFRAHDMNLERYGSNNPTTITDPTGLIGQGQLRQRLRQRALQYVNWRVRNAEDEASAGYNGPIRSLLVQIQNANQQVSAGNGPVRVWWQKQVKNLEAQYSYMVQQRQLAKKQAAAEARKEAIKMLKSWANSGLWFGETGGEWQEGFRLGDPNGNSQ